MAYSYLSLKAPGVGRLNRAASTVLNPLNKQQASPTPAPSYGQQISGLLSADRAPQFATGATSSGGASSGGAGAMTFSNDANPAFQGFQAPTLNAANGVDWSNDPIYQQTLALVQSQMSQMQAQAIAAEKQNLIRYGSPDLVSQVLGKGADQETIDAAKNNSFSTVAELGRWNTRALSGIDSATNRNNLFFSSTRGRDRGLQQEDYVRQQAGTANQLQDALSGIATGLMNAQSGAQTTLLGSAESAYMRALQAALANGGSTPPPPAGGGATAQPNAVYGGGPTGGPGGYVGQPWWAQYGYPKPPYLGTGGRGW